MTGVKICGITAPDASTAAIDSNVDFLGFVFFKRSIRNLDPITANTLVSRVPAHIKTVGLFVDPVDAEIDYVLAHTKLDMLQLHGNEDASRIANLKSKYKLPVLRAIKVAAPEDLFHLGAIQSVADWILFDAKAEGSNAVPGGNGVVFDWRLLQNLKITKPWMLSGGLNAQNIREALSVLSPDAVDVSSGVDETPGVKSPAKIREFINLVKSA